MNRRTVLRLTTASLLCTGVVFSAGQAPAQKSLKDQLVGAWTLVTSEATSPKGSKTQAFGANPRGILILDAGGHYAVVQGKPDRSKLKASANLRQETSAADFGEAARGFAANFGTWSVDESGKILIRRYQIALIPNNDTQETKASIGLAGNELRLTITSAAGAKNETVYRRAK